MNMSSSRQVAATFVAPTERLVIDKTARRTSWNPNQDQHSAPLARSTDICRSSRLPSEIATVNEK